MGEDDIIKSVTLLGIYKKKEGESLRDVMLMLVETGMYGIKEAKQVFKELKSELYISDGELTLKGITQAKRAEEMFKQH